MSCIHGTIVEIENGVLTLSSSVHVRVPASVLGRVTVGDTITLYAHAVTVKRRGLVLFGFTSESQRASFAAYLADDASDPVGALTMVEAGIEPPLPPDLDVPLIKNYLKDAVATFGITDEQMEAYIAQTDRNNLVLDRAEETFHIIAKDVREGRL